MVNQQKCITFYLDSFFFGVEVLKVQEVIRFQEMTPVPLALSVVSGLINLRGQIVTAMDLRRRLRLSERSADDLPMNVVVRCNEEAVSFLVDEIGDVLEVQPDLYEPLPETLSGPVREAAEGVYKLKERLLIMLDVEKILHVREDHSS